MQRIAKIQRRQRQILLLILAFCVDTLRPTINPTGHHHAGGELPHVHVGEVAHHSGNGHARVFGAGLTARSAPAHGKVELTTASRTDLHFHLPRPLQLAHVAPLSPVPTIGRHQLAPARDPGAPQAASAQPGTARGPPLFLV